jgi:hypothetical protein
MQPVRVVVCNATAGALHFAGSNPAALTPSRTTCIRPLLAHRNTEHGSGLGRFRWVVKRTFAWLNQFRRLRVCYEKRADIHEAFLSLVCALICWRFSELVGLPLNGLYHDALTCSPLRLNMPIPRGTSL